MLSRPAHEKRRFCLASDIGGSAIDECEFLIHHCYSSRQTTVDPSSRGKTHTRFGIAARPASELIGSPVDLGQASAQHNSSVDFELAQENGILNLPPAHQSFSLEKFEALRHVKGSFELGCFDSLRALQARDLALLARNPALHPSALLASQDTNRALMPSSHGVSRSARFLQLASVLFCDCSSVRFAAAEGACAVGFHVFESCRHVAVFAAVGGEEVCFGLDLFVFCFREGDGVRVAEVVEC